MAPADTTVEAREAQWAVYRSMGPAQRFAVAVDLSEAIREVARSGIRAQHPSWGDDEVQAELERRLYGPELAAEVATWRERR